MIGKGVRLVLALKAIPRVGDKRIIDYLNESNRKNSTFYDNVIETKKVPGINKLLPEDWNRFLEQADNEIEKANDFGINIISYLDDEYPLNLRALPNAPTILYVKGNYKLLNTDKSVAIIGTREPTEYGKKIDLLFSKTLSLDGFTIISGLAIGCDTYAHQGTLTGSGKTIAILAHGLDQPVYPKQNRNLANRILEQDGALLSTYPIGTKLRPQYLAARDEWQSGMSDGVLVIETGIKGGTRIAMGHSVKQKRPLAVIDYRERGNLGSEALKIQKFQGNFDAIMHENAIPVFSKEKLESFEKIMIKEHLNRLDSIQMHKVSGTQDSNQLDLF
ncbi:DNA-processing protein DprA [Limosilactobacillus reuteri]|uniref:DNA-processing protein DprA n=1 Tax=Limosilactobacillus reuteri TaxID=1598 RepID=UPI003D782B0C